MKKRTKRLTELFQSYEPYGHKLGEIQDVLVTEIAHDKKHYVGHNKYYEQVSLMMEKVHAVLGLFTISSKSLLQVPSYLLYFYS